MDGLLGRLRNVEEFQAKLETLKREEEECNKRRGEMLEARGEMLEARLEQLRVEAEERAAENLSSLKKGYDAARRTGFSTEGSGRDTENSRVGN